MSRLDEYRGFTSSEPCALFLTEGHHISTFESQLLTIAFRCGFAVYAAPWFTLKPNDRGILAMAPTRMTANGLMPTTDWCWIRPRLLTPLFPVDAITGTTMRRLANENSRAIVSFHPHPEVETSRVTTASHLRLIPALLQAQPPLLRLYMEPGSGRERALALLKTWWSQREQQLRLTRIFHRLLLTINLYIDESTDAGERLVRVDFVPCRRTTATPRGSFWLKRACSWLRLAYARSCDSPKLLLPKPSYFLSSPSNTFLTADHPRSCGERHDDSSPKHSLAREEGRMHLRHELETALSKGEERTLTLDKPSTRAYPGLSVRARKAGEHAVLEFIFSNDSSLAKAPHPLSALLPSLDRGHCYVETRSRKDAELVFIDPKLSGPQFAANTGNARASVLEYLGRTIVEEHEDPTDLFGRRYVEPGSGRAYLVDFLRIDDRPELLDFSVIGGGLTPYARGGYIDIGRPVDGKLALGRALHRKRCADRLEELGCRTAPVIAIVVLRDDHISLPNGELPVASLLIRGFRSVLRIKQLDPIACLHHGYRARPNLVSFLTDGRCSLSEEKHPRQSRLREEQLFSIALDRYGVSGVLPTIASDHLYGFDRVDPNSRALRCRSRATRLYSPFLVDVIKFRVAMEIGRDPVCEPLANLEYATWFASTMGRQLALCRRAGFLHDYHQEGIAASNQLPWWLYSLGENNITLMAELPDLDTGIFVDAPDEGSVEELHLTHRDLAILSRNFYRFHRRDLRIARSAVCTLVTIVCHGQSTAIEPVLRCFESAYATTVGPAYSRLL